MDQLKVGVVIVTFNRIGELKKALPCYEKQSLSPAYIIVVDNCSSDGTDAYLKEWESQSGVCERILITLPENRGGSGGFYAGLKMAQDREDADWIWVADDDAFPRDDAFEQADAFLKKHAELEKQLSAFCGMCVGDDKIASIHQARILKTIFGSNEFPVPKEEFEKEYFEHDLYSFAGTFLRRTDLLKAGLPREDFFIYQDDYEHACRMRKLGKIICVPGIYITHNDNYVTGEKATWRDYYATRNIVIMYREHFDRRSVFLRILRRYMFVCVSRDWMKLKICRQAVKDGKAGIAGLHPVYRPGWKA